VFDVATTKTEKMAKPVYERCACNYLLIYINQALPVFNIKEGASLCSERLKEYWGSDSFDQIMVEEGESIVIFTPNAYEILKLNNLWANG
jgi:hypothetical protein